MLIRCLLGIIVLAGARVASAEPVAVRHDQPPLSGSLETLLPAQGLQLAGQPLVPWEALAYWGKHPARWRSSQVHLREGGWLAVDVLQLDRSAIRGVSSTFGELRIPAEQVSAVILQPLAPAAERDRGRPAPENGTEDQVYLNNGDVLQGELSATPAAAAAAEAPALYLQLAGASAPLAIPLGRVRRVQLAAPPAAQETLQEPLVDAQASPWLWVGLHDGSLLRTRLRSIAAGELGLEAAGLLLQSPQPLSSALDFIQPLTERVTYLSDLPALGYRHIPFLERAWNYGRDRNAAGHWLRANGSLWPKGLGMYSTSRLAYAWEGTYATLELELAVDDQAERRGSIVLRVFGEAGADTPAETWQLLYESPLIRGGDAPLPVRVDVSRTQRLALIVDFADRGDEQDLANLLNARLVRP